MRVRTVTITLPIDAADEADACESILSLIRPRDREWVRANGVFGFGGGGDAPAGPRPA